MQTWQQSRATIFTRRSLRLDHKKHYLDRRNSTAFRVPYETAGESLTLNQSADISTSKLAPPFWQWRPTDHKSAVRQLFADISTCFPTTKTTETVTLTHTSCLQENLLFLTGSCGQQRIKQCYKIIFRHAEQNQILEKTKDAAASRVSRIVICVNQLFWSFSRTITSD